MSAICSAWCFAGIVFGFLAHVLIQALDPRNPWDRGYDAGWKAYQRSRWAREGPGAGPGDWTGAWAMEGSDNPERN
jgi:hypothetical protein